MIDLISLLEHAYKRRKFYKCDVEYGNRPTFSGLFPIFDLNGKLKLGRDVIFAGVRVRSHITVFNPDAVLSIGDSCYLNDGVNICAVESIEIGRHCAIGDWVTILDTAFHPVEQGGETHVGPIRIGNNVWIASQAMIAPGVTIGDHSVIGAGSLVTHDIPEKVLAAGSPAKILHEITCDDHWIRPFSASSSKKET